MTTAPHSPPTRVSRTGLLLLSTALLAFATPATSGSRQSQGGPDARHVSRLTFTGTFRFRPAPVAAQRAPARPASPIVKPDTVLSKQQVKARPRPILSPATRSSLGAPPKRDVKPAAAKAPPVTAATRAAPPLPTRLKRHVIKKRIRTSRPASRAARITQPTPKPRHTKPAQPATSSIFDEPPLWAKDALFAPN